MSSIIEIFWILAGLLAAAGSFTLWLNANRIVKSKYHIPGYLAFNALAVVSLVCFGHDYVAKVFF